MKAVALTVTFDPKWVLSEHLNGKPNVISDVVEVIREKLGAKEIFVIKKEAFMCSFVAVCESVLAQEELTTELKKAFSGIGEDANINIKSEELNAQKLADVLTPVSYKFDEESIDLLKKEFGVDLAYKKEQEEKSQEVKPQEKKSESAQDEEKEAKINIDDFIALDPLKKWVDEIIAIDSKYGEIVKGSKLLTNCAYLISINRGNGLSTVLEIMAKTLAEHGFSDEGERTRVMEWTFEYPKRPDEPSSIGELAHRVDRILTKDLRVGVVAINIEEWIDYLHEKQFAEMLDFVWNLKEHISFVFTIPYVDDDVIEKVYSRINDIISVRYMKFVPPSDMQYYEYFVRYFEKLNMSVDEKAFPVFVTKIVEEKNDGRFFGFNTVKKIADELMYNVILKAATNNADLPQTVTADALCEVYGLDKTDGLSGFEQLEGMIALREVKDRVREILSTVKLQKELSNNGNKEMKPCFHMMFTGNPGTGKTVVARIVGRIFKEEGILSVGNFYEVSRKDFVGKFVGHTAPKTMEICRNAIGSVLFIDEAYTLANERDGYSSEAIGTLIAEMENNRDKMVVIFAGYEKELEALFEMNPGLKDRIPHKIHFPNYDREELKQIFCLQFKNKIKYDESFVKKTDEFFADFPESVMQMRDFSNGRFVRNMAERIMAKAAMRFELSGEEIGEFELTNADFEAAVTDADYTAMFAKTKKVVKTIGFKTN